MSGWHPNKNKASGCDTPPKNSAQGFRQLAEAEWSAALNEPLPQRRQQRERSAMRWDEMAKAAEGHAMKAAVNARDKLPRSDEGCSG
ncbi:hypothetical protein [Sphingomonas sp. PAMC 26605]|uniref:hypothetical protein n=1 Tax=Sphingomonas sp. PAMC 26605 TaxID=1112214 RepID=UPI000568B3D5|nr:hypothetical protein [Sphingomonas sp. PAMC 26605]